MIRDDTFQLHLPIPDKTKSLPQFYGNAGQEVFVPFAYGPDGIDLVINLPLFEEQFGLVSDQAAASLAFKGLVAAHEDELSEVRLSVFRDYITDDYIRSHIRLDITPKSDMEFVIDPWFHVISRLDSTVVVSIDADVVYDVYRDLETENDIMDLD